MNQGGEPLVVIAVELPQPKRELERLLLEDKGVRVEYLIAHGEEEMSAGLAEARAVCVGNVPVTRRVIETMTNAWIIVRLGAGINNIDIKAATEHGICVANVPGASTQEVAAHAVALILACGRAITHGDRHVRAGGFDFNAMPTLHRLQGSAAGLVGFGRIARETARLLSSFRMTIRAHDPFVTAEEMASLGVVKCSLAELLSYSDYVSIHVPLSQETARLIGEAELRLMKPGAYLINTSRGGVIDEHALAEALVSGRLAGAGLDVMAEEPPSADNPLLKLENVVFTPHMGALAEESGRDARTSVVEAVRAALAGQWPDNLINTDLKQGIPCRARILA